MPRTGTCLTIEDDLKRKAKEYGINLSQFVNEKLEEEVGLECRIEKINREIERNKSKIQRLEQEKLDCYEKLKIQEADILIQNGKEEDKANSKIQKAIDVLVNRIRVTHKLDDNALFTRAKMAGVDPKELKKLVFKKCMEDGIDVIK